MGLKIKFACAVAILLVISTSCGNKQSNDSDFQVTPDVVENKDVPEMQGIVTDLEGLFNDIAKERLQQKAELMEEEYNLPICILTVASFEPFENFTDFSDNVASQWEYCSNEEGILFILSSFLGELRVIACTKTETRISDEDFDTMINDIMYESFRNEGFEDGLINALDFLETKFTTS